MVYYTIYIKNLHNNTGYIDVCLEDEQLLRDYLQYLDIGVKTHNSYAVISPADMKPKKGHFAINLDDIAAVTTMQPS